jgi:hypothetical protein
MERRHRPLLGRCIEGAPDSPISEGCLCPSGSATMPLVTGDHREVTGAPGTASAVLARFAIVEAGRASAADPRATFEPQRRAAI